MPASGNRLLYRNRACASVSFMDLSCPFFSSRFWQALESAAHPYLANHFARCRTQAAPHGPAQFHLSRSGNRLADSHPRVVVAFTSARVLPGRRHRKPFSAIH
jgi:hypothetical protein